MQYDEIVALLPDYLDDKLSNRQKLWVESALKESEELQLTLSSLQDLHQAKADWQDEAVPEWHRTAFAVRSRQRPTNWMNWLSLATSMAAICLVVFRVQIISNPEGYQISFGDQAQVVAFKQQANELLDNYHEEQVAYLDHRFLEFENKQLIQNQQTLSAALEYNRNQRHQDMTQLTSFLIQQRSRDQLKNQTQYKHLANIQSEDRQAIKNIYSSLQKENY